MEKIGIVAFAFGSPSNIRSNELIAQIASQKAQELNAPVYTQFDVCIKQGIEVVYTDEKHGNPPPTLRIARGAIRWAKQQKIWELWIVAAKPHLWRCERDVKEAIQETKSWIKIHTCEEIEHYPEEEWFCSNSTQVYTQSKKQWQKRDFVLMLMPMQRYKIIAS